MYIKKFAKAVRHNYTSLGKALGVTRQTVANWEKGSSVPTQLMLERLAKELNVTVKQIMEG